MPALNYQFANGTGNMSLGLRTFIQWLTDGAGSAALSDIADDGPLNIEVIEADDQTIREVPSGGTTLSDLSGGNLWNDANSTQLPTGSWITVRFIGTLGTAFQVFFKINSSLNFEYQLIPLNDWATGGGTTSTPTKPATATPATAPIVVDGANWTARAACDDGVIAYVTDDGSTVQRGFYVGEVDEADAADTKPFVISEFPTVWSLSTSNEWQRLSPVDDTTILTNGTFWCMAPISSGFNWETASPQYTDFHDRIRSPVGIGFTDTSHQHIAGYLRYVNVTSKAIALRATFDTKAQIGFNDLTGHSAALVLDWDGLTDYP